MDEPIQMSSSLPGDAHSSPSPSPSPPPQPSTSAPSAPQASTSTVPYSEPKTYDLLSVHPSDPSKQRSFSCRYFLAPSSDYPPSSRFLDLPESYFTPTAVELQQAFAGQVKKRKELVDKPLLTQKLREREEAQKNRQKASKWPQTRVRVRFGDRSQLEGIFPSTDKLIHLYEFVKLALREDLRETPFLLYQSPPRTEYTKADPAYRGKTLIDLQFTPSTVLYIKFLEREELNDPASQPPLRSELLEIAAQLPPPPSFDPTSDKSQESQAGKAKTKNTLGMGGDKGKVVPSWLKLGGNKFSKK
ncbi:uncharacterized protein JCM6883_000688 [Sporobolomyces salmoneus]|uniref:uncharacterized protein n=1 Tax=Sporobolomyces salmoneus TaxID=183962 RepID=UPI00317D3CDE